MKRNLLLLFVASALIFSCSSDDNGGGDDTPTEDKLVGTWDLSTIEIDDDIEDQDLEFAKDIVDVLIAQDCNLLTLIFAADGTLTIQERDFSDVEINVNQGGTGLDIPCPDADADETAEWSLDGNQLTITFEDTTSETVTVAFDGNNTLIVDAEFVDEDNLSDATAVFAKR